MPTVCCVAMFLASTLSWGLFLGTGHQSQPETVVTIKLQGPNKKAGIGDLKAFGNVPGIGTAFVAIVALPTVSMSTGSNPTLTPHAPSLHRSGC